MSTYISLIEITRCIFPYLYILCLLQEESHVVVFFLTLAKMYLENTDPNTKCTRIIVMRTYINLTAEQNDWVYIDFF